MNLILYVYIYIYIVYINKKWNNSILNCEAYSSFEGVSSDHRIVMAKIRLRLRRNAAQTTTVHYDWSLLNNRDIGNKYMLTLRNKFDAPQEIPTANNKYENFVNVHIEAVAEYIPTKQRAKPRVPWETLAVRKKARRRKNCFQMQLEKPRSKLASSFCAPNLFFLYIYIYIYISWKCIPNLSSDFAFKKTIIQFHTSLDIHPHHPVTPNKFTWYSTVTCTFEVPNGCNCDT